MSSLQEHNFTAPCAGAPPWLVIDASLPNMFEGVGAAEDAEFAAARRVRAPRHGFWGPSNTRHTRYSHGPPITFLRARIARAGSRRSSRSRRCSRSELGLYPIVALEKQSP